MLVQTHLGGVKELKKVKVLFVSEKGTPYIGHRQRLFVATSVIVTVII
jgi:hypothetical protein